jgi:ferredoxin
VVAWWLPLSERLSTGGSWGLLLGIGGLLLAVPRIARRPREGSWAPSHVDPRLCTGCNQCPQDCPWEAITMVERDDDRPTLVALVNPDLCVSCGICAGSCAPMGVGPPGRTGRDQLLDLRERVLPGMTAEPSASIVAICCAQAPRSHVRAVQQRGAVVHEVACVGNLHSSVVERFLRDGFGGVIVNGCAPRDCTGREGPKWLVERLFHDREAELQARVDRRRVLTATFAAGALADSLAAYDSFAREVAALDRPARSDEGTDELLCDPVPLEADAR